MPSQCVYVCLLLYLVPFSFGLIALLPPLCLLHEKIIQSIFTASQAFLLLGWTYWASFSLLLRDTLHPCDHCHSPALHLPIHEFTFPVTRCLPVQLRFHQCLLLDLLLPLLLPQMVGMDINGLSLLTCMRHVGFCCRLGCGTELQYVHPHHPFCYRPYNEIEVSTILGVISRLSLLLTPFSLHSRPLLFLSSFYLYC